MLLRLGDLPAKGYASHGESWSYALALRLASYELLRSEGAEPVLILDDVFAELDARRRERLAELVRSQGPEVQVAEALRREVLAARVGAGIYTQQNPTFGALATHHVADGSSAPYSTYTLRLTWPLDVPGVFRGIDNSMGWPQVCQIAGAHPSPPALTNGRPLPYSSPT